ncbi:PTS sugar transporter subunit IIB [Pseudodesulfovibrio sp. zrk46]|uniref:PTS sugar transporter subunit IIB n=1 Tax=Pseudodesulfovibrio sp. zrk46 TaxID=2725288 RepID=UPI001449A2F1|nr:PTS sugar transporter subunit IIB [Pseudodesulfovibrio sp. zrk46]QJB57659.1 PTS sugar transporter subunit IIB [Pseudodesulfovibrio sp. zrk46]
MTLVRIDNRLIHGQIIETWLPHTGAKTVIVSNDALAADMLQQEIMSLAIPQTISCIFCSIEQLADEIEERKDSGESESILVLFSSCPDAKRAYECGFGFEVLNIGNVHYSPGKKQISPSVALSDDDESCLKQLSQKGVELDFRCVPNDPIQVRF